MQNMTMAKMSNVTLSGKAVETEETIQVLRIER
jgi:hypothetical protein